ncbi:MAG: ABC transporter permease [Terrabacter sp.]
MTQPSTTTTTTTTTEQPALLPGYPTPGLARQVKMMVWRNLKHTRRQPEMLTDVTIQPIMFTVLFAFVFGGSIQTDSGSYREWLLPGIMAQTMAFASFIVANGLNMDLEKGIIDRFRSLPISRGAVLVGRSVYGIIHSSIGIFVMSMTGLVIGWRIRDGVGNAVLAFALLLLFGFSMIWVGILVGSAMRSVEAVNGLMFTTMFPITFLANTFAPTEAMAPWLRTVAEWNPISALVQAMRELWGNVPPAPADASWPLQHAVLVSIGWSLLITAAIAPLAVRAYVRRTAD